MFVFRRNMLLRLRNNDASLNRDSLSSGGAVPPGRSDRLRNGGEEQRWYFTRIPGVLAGTEGIAVRSAKGKSI